MVVALRHATMRRCRWRSIRANRTKLLHSTLHADASQGNKDALLSSLDAGAAVDERDNFCMTPLMHAANKGHVDCVRLLIGRGADVHLRSDDSMTAAHFAAFGGHTEVLLALFDAGVAVDVTDSDLMTPLMCAACCGHLECLLLLIQRGADVCHHRVGGWTAAHYAAARCGNAEMLRVLIASGADLLPLAGYHSVVDSACVASQLDAASFALACGCRFALTCREIECQASYLFPHVVCSLSSVNCAL